MGVKLLGKIKIYELAKEMDMESKKLIEIAVKNGMDVKSHLSSISEEECKTLKKIAKGDALKKQEKTAENAKKTKKTTETPVIIRREIIINEDETKKKELEKKKQEEQARRNDVGFINQNRNKDYNIVYRNKPTKPMTMNELFGIGKKEEKPKVEEKKNSPIEEKEEVKSQVEDVKSETSPVQQTKETNPTNHAQRNTYNNNRNNNFNHRNNNNRNSSYNRNGDNRGAYNNRNGENRSNFTSNRNGNYNRNNNNNFNHGNTNQRRDNNRPNFQKKQGMDDKRIDKKIKNIMEIDIPEKDNVRDYNNNNKNRDRMKQNQKMNDQRQPRKNRKNGESDFNSGKLNNLKKQNQLSNMFDEGEMLDYYDLSTERGKRGKKRNKAQENRIKQKIFKLTEITIPENITVKDLAVEMKITSSEVIKKLLGLGVMATINDNIDFDTAYLIAQEFGINAIKKNIVTDEDILIDETEDTEDELQPRPPVIVVMGHVDHGKTSLLDAIRKTNVIEGESGGITQHIGAYQVEISGRQITFLDTPGHEAFTSMRARGAMITDIAILVVAANDGVMPQTIEAINHAKAAEIPIIVAVNKMDLPDANMDKVKQELMQYELVPEEWGGDTIFVPISAKQGMGIDNLLEMVLLEADVLELKANPTKQAKGTIIEAKLDKTRGPVATMLVQRGKLDVGDTIIVGSSIGRIRTMKNAKGKNVKFALPSTPVEITGLHSVPETGDTFYEVKDEKTAKHLIEKRKYEQRQKSIAKSTVVTLDDLFSKIESENLKQLNLIVKADVQGSVEALKQSLEKLSNDEVRVKVIHSNVGGVTETDVTLAKVSSAIIIAFNVRPEVIAKTIADKEEVEIKTYSVIYDAINDIEAAMKGLLDPIYKEVVIGNAEIRQIFKVSNVGTIAGCYVQTGKVTRNAGIRVIRDNIVLHDGKLISLKRFKDDVKEVDKGYECGLQIENYNDIQEGDTLEVYIMEEVKR